MLLRAPNWLHTEQLKASLAYCSSSNMFMRNVLNSANWNKDISGNLKMLILFKALTWLHSFCRVSDFPLFMQDQTLNANLQ